LANFPTAEIKASLVKKYRSSNHAANARARIQEIVAIVSVSNISASGAY
jgi:hypothetical protein